MQTRRKGGADPAGGEVFTSGSSAGSTGPIGDFAERHLSPNRVRNTQSKSGHETRRQTVTLRPLRQSSPKKRKADDDVTLYLSDDEFADAFEKIAENIWERLVSRKTTSVPADERHWLRDEMRNSIGEVQTQFAQLLNEAVAKMQAEAETRAEAMFQRVMQALEARRIAGTCTSISSSTTSRQQGSATKDAEPQVQPQSKLRSRQVTQQTWSKVARAAAQSVSEWTTVTHKNKKPKKHPLEQRRILFVRNDPAPRRDPRDVMFEVNKTLAQAKAEVAVRLINLRYTKKGHLSGLMNETASASDLLRYGAAVFAKAHEVDPTIIDIEKTEKWRKLRIHGVALDRYLNEDGLDLAREEIELTSGISLAYMPHWIKSDTLAERFESGAIRQSTLVVTVKSKEIADTMLAKGLSFGGKRHEVERFWLPGEGGICTHCCGPDHFGRCTEPAKCFVCAGEHEGIKHRCATVGCGKKSEPCDHEAAKCANCGGSHVATSRRCPERMQRPQKHKERPDMGMRSSPPTTSEAQSSTTEQVADAEDMDEDAAATAAGLAGETVPAQPPSVTPRRERRRPSPSWTDSMSDSEADLEMSTPTPRGKGQTPMSFDHDSATA